MKTGRFEPSHAAALGLGLVLLAGVVAMPGPAPAQEIDVESILRCTASDDEGRAACGEARRLILDNCTVCHTYGPIVLQQFDAEGWVGAIDRHRDRVPHLDEGQIGAIRTYLTANFSPELEPPEVPEALLRAWTDY